jgi:hypothetical protein
MFMPLMRCPSGFELNDDAIIPDETGGVNTAGETGEFGMIIKDYRPKSRGIHRTEKIPPAV